MRDKSIDVLRFIGLSLIILAHVSPPNIIFQLRTFDVPLMLFVSGLTLYGKNPKISWNYIFNRTLRLILPVYLFLTIYFCLIFIAQYFGMDFGITIRHCIGSFLLMDGIGYVWIIRIFLMVALITPILVLISKKVNTLTLILICSIVTLSLDLLIRNDILISNVFVKDFVYYAIGYSVPLLCALKVPYMNTKEIILTSFFFFSLLLFQGWWVYSSSIINGGGIIGLIFSLLNILLKHIIFFGEFSHLSSPI